jgi:hypothetical protein
MKLMKNFLIYIFFACFFINYPTAKAEEAGKVFIDILPEKKEINKNEFTIYRQLEKLIERYRYFEEKFPEDAIDGDIYSDVAAIYPYLGYQELEDKIDDIRYTIKTYRRLKKLYYDIKEKMLIPAPPPLIVDEEDYDTKYTSP